MPPPGHIPETVAPGWALTITSADFGGLGAVAETLDQLVPLRPDHRPGELGQSLVVRLVASPGVVSVGPVVLPLLDMPATPAGKILLRVYARSVGVHLYIREEPTVSVTTVHHGVSAKENRGVVLRQLGLNPDFAPPITNQGLRCLPDGVDRGLVGDLQGDAPVLRMPSPSVSSTPALSNSVRAPWISWDRHPSLAEEEYLAGATTRLHAGLPEKP